VSHFIVADRKTDYLLPPSLDDWLNEDHLARFVVEVVDQLDLSNLTRQYAGRGSKAHHPATLLAILVYGYATGVFSSRRLERATYDSVAFRYLAAGSHPDHDTLATFRRRFLGELEDLFAQVLEMAQEMKLLKLGTVCLDGTKIHANASRHSALSHGHIEKLEAQIKAQVQELLVLLCHKCNLTSQQHGHRGSLLVIARAMSNRNVEIESGTWRCTRPAAARDVTFG